jgi:hypothetical protein
VESDNEDDQSISGVKRKRDGAPTKRKPFKRKEPMKGKPRSYIATLLQDQDAFHQKTRN